MKRNKWIILCLAGCLALALSACASQNGSDDSSDSSDGNSAAGSSQQEQETLVEYTVEGLGTFQLPEGFTMDSGEITEPLPTRYATFQKDDYYIQANRFGTDAYEMAGVALPMT